MARVGKTKRLRRQARLVRQHAWLRSFWGEDWRAERQLFLRCVPLTRSTGRQLRRMALKARLWYQPSDPITDILRAIERAPVTHDTPAELYDRIREQLDARRINEAHASPRVMTYERAYIHIGNGRPAAWKRNWTATVEVSNLVVTEC